MVKRSIYIAAAVLVVAIGVKAQPVTSLQFGSTTEILNTASTGAGFGSSYSLPTSAANVVAWQLNGVGGPSAISATLQVSLDGSTWISLSTCTSTSGCLYNMGVSSFRYIRTQYTSRTGGTATQAIVTVARAYPTTSTTAGINPTLAGNLLFSPDGTYNIGGSSTTNRPLQIFSSGTITAGAGVVAGNPTAGGFVWGSHGRMLSTADGSFILVNNAQTGATRLTFGPATASFAAVEAVGATLRARLGDNSANASFAAANLVLSATAFASLPADANGTFRYCSDCTVAATCAGGGTGAYAKRLNGVWVCN